MILQFSLFIYKQYINSWFYFYIVHFCNWSLFTSPAKAVKKYCDEYVCVCMCVCVREDIYGTTCATFTQFLCMLPIAVARSSSGKIHTCISLMTQLSIFVT